MDKKRDLAKNTVIFFIGKICTQFLSFLFLPLYTAYLTTSDYGVVDLITTYITLLVPVITIQMEMAVFRYLVDAREDEQKIKTIISNVLCIALSLTCLFIVGYFILTKFISFSYSYLILLNIIFCIINSLFLQIARGFGKNKVYSISCCITGVITILLNVILIVFCKMGATGMLGAVIVANLTSAIYLFISLKIYKYVVPSMVEKKQMKLLAKYSLPLVPNGISWWIVNASNRTVISIFLNVGANGIFAVANKFATVFIGAFNIFNLSWTESAALHIHDKDRNEFFSDMINLIFKIFSSLCILIIVCMPFLFPILIDGKYSEAYMHIPILMIATLCNIMVGLYSAIYIAKKLTKQVAITSIVSAIINVGINVICIQFIGLYAASFSTLIAYFCMMVYRHFDLKKYTRIVLDKKYITYSSVLLLLSTFLYYINMFLFNILGLLIGVSFAFFVNKNLLVNAFTMIKRRVLKH